jgi:ATP-dependent DNA helicase RecG
MVQAGHDPPIFRATSYSFSVTLYRARHQPTAPRSALNMNDRQSRALTYVREHGSISNREYQQICPDVSSETLRLDLKDLVDRNVLLKIGSKKGTHYILR